MIGDIDHVAVAVRSIEKTLPFYEKILGFRLEGIKTVEGEGVRVAMLIGHNMVLELLESVMPESAVNRFIEKRGEGLHHICFSTTDLKAASASLQNSGIAVIGDKEPRISADGNRIAFIHPKDTGGVLIELKETDIITETQS